METSREIGDKQGDGRQAWRGETEIQENMKAGRQRDRQGDGRQAWRRETERQGDMKTGRKGDKRKRDRRQAGRWETGMQS